ncbi:MAG: GDSL-type esterase/lipase family protein [Planctomycetaceae bacterium]
MRSASLILCLIGNAAMASAFSESSLSEFHERLVSGRPTTIVCFGDSITGAYYHTGGQRAWCDMLGIALQKAQPGAKPLMINAGLSGHTTVNALARIDHDVLAHQPQLVVVMFGMNDVTRVPIDQYEANLRTIVQKCRDIKAAVVLCTPNSVLENTDRPNSKLADYSRIVRRIADEQQLPLADCFEHYQQLRKQNELKWSLLMSDAIHPNMTGHRRFAELIANTILNRDVSLDGTPAPDDALSHTLARLSDGQPVRIVAMPPYDTLFAERLRHHFPDARVQVTVWPVQDQSMAQLAVWGQRIRGLKPDLVIPAVPQAAVSGRPETWIADYEWVLNYSFAFSGRPWDVVPVLPLSGTPTSDSEQTNSAIARQIVVGKDVAFVERPADDKRSPEDIVNDWIDAQQLR